MADLADDVRFPRPQIFKRQAPQSLRYRLSAFWALSSWRIAPKHRRQRDIQDFADLEQAHRTDAPFHNAEFVETRRL